jgi:hypothetical protein
MLTDVGPNIAVTGTGTSGRVLFNVGQSIPEKIQQRLFKGAIEINAKFNIVL